MKSNSVKFFDFEGIIMLLQELPHKTLSTKVGKRKITYSVAIGPEGEKVDFHISKKLAQLSTPIVETNITEGIPEQV
jgi:hypothetical protein